MSDRSEKSDRTDITFTYAINAVLLTLGRIQPLERLLVGKQIYSAGNLQNYVKTGDETKLSKRQARSLNRYFNCAAAICEQFL